MIFASLAGENSLLDKAGGHMLKMASFVTNDPLVQDLAFQFQWG